MARKKLFVCIDMEEDDDTDCPALDKVENMAELFHGELNSFQDMTLHAVYVYDTISELQAEHFDFLTIKGFSSLTPEQADLFARTYKRHYNAHGTEARMKRTPDQIKAIKWDSKERCLKVYFKDEWYHYDTKGDWY